MRLSAERLSRQFGDCISLSEVSLEFAPGKIHAVLGENGAGKSTLLKVLFGLYPPTAGRILLDGQAVEWNSPTDAIARGLGMVQQHFTLVDSLSAVDNITLGAEVCSQFGFLRREQAIARLESLLPSRHMQVNWHARVAELSVGERQRIEILKLLFRDAKILFLDEPTAVLTPMEVEEFFSVLRTLRDKGKTVVLITHKIGEVMQLCDTYSVLRHGRLVSSGLVADCSADQLVEDMIGRKLPEFSIPRAPSRDVVALDVNDVRGAGLKSLSMHVKYGEIVGVAGVEGSGQSALVDTLMGLRPFDGRIKFLGEEISGEEVTKRVRQMGIALIPEERGTQGLWLDESCFTNMILGLEDDFVRNGVLQADKIEATTREWAAQFDVRASSLDVAVGSLSGGNQQKVIFAREVAGRKPHFLLCHQPTRGVDLGAVDLVHRCLMDLRNQGLGILVLSSDLDELLKLCDRLYVIYEGQISGHFPRAQFSRLQIGSAMTGAAT